MIPQISISNGQPVIFLPLIVIVIITGLKDLLEDSKRKRSDNEENKKPIKILKNNQPETSSWEEIRVGEVIRVIIRNFTKKLSKGGTRSKLSM